MTLHRSDIPDALFPSEPRFGIPLLKPSLQANFLDAPVLPWGGAGSRRRINRGTWHFYVDDYRWQELVWKNPAQLVNTQCVTAVEPNFSLFPQTPAAVAIGLTYRKRWCARYWQELGVRILVDLNVAPEHMETNLLGVPPGWRAFATHGYDDRPEDLEREYSVARTWYGSDDLLFVVYGGGERTQLLCRQLGPAVIHVPETRTMARRSASNVITEDGDMNE